MGGHTICYVQTHLHKHTKTSEVIYNAEFIMGKLKAEESQLYTQSFPVWKENNSWMHKDWAMDRGSAEWNKLINVHSHTYLSVWTTCTLKGQCLHCHLCQLGDPIWNVWIIARSLNTYFWFNDHFPVYHTLTHTMIHWLLWRERWWWCCPTYWDTTP